MDKGIVLDQPKSRFLGVREGCFVLMMPGTVRVFGLRHPNSRIVTRAARGLPATLGLDLAIGTTDEGASLHVPPSDTSTDGRSL